VSAVQTRPLRLGVLGAGSWAVASHIPNLMQRPDDVTLVGAARHGDPELLGALRDRFGFSVVSEDYRDVLAAGIDVAVVASPTALHHEHAKAALEAGAHVLVEKPVTIDPVDAWDLVETADRLRRHLVVSFGWNFRPLLSEAKRLMEERGVGQIEHVAIRMSSFTRELLSNSGAYPKAATDTRPEQATWTDASLSGGGYAQAQLSHALGAALWLTGLRGSEVFAYMSAPLGAPVELHDAVVLRYTNGAIGTLSGTSSHNGVGVVENELTIHVVGRDGQFSLDIERGRAWLGRRDGQEVVELGHPGGLYDCDGPPHALLDLALGVEGAVNRAPGELGARTVEILAAAYRSAVTGRSETVG
jgi:predicted dehydrogenase